VDEDRIDYDLLEDLIAYIDTEKEEGAMLVFLPGEAPHKLCAGTLPHLSAVCHATCCVPSLLRLQLLSLLQLAVSPACRMR
jgi:hypothetical protein